MTTARELLDLIDSYVAAKAGSDADPDRLQSIAQQFDVALTDMLIDRASMQNEA